MDNNDAVKWVNNEILKYWRENKNKLIKIKKRCNALYEKEGKSKKSSRNECKNTLKRWPLLYPPFSKEKGIGPGGIVFVGFNPSFNIENEETKKDIEKFPFGNEEKIKKLKKEIIKFERNSWQEYKKYFKPIKDLVKGINEICDKKFYFYHVDLLFMRGSPQKILADLFGIKDGKPKHYMEFFNRQVALSLKFIEKLEPKLIVVINALTSHTIKARFNLPSLSREVIENGKTWFYEIPLGKEEKKYPIIFSGMISGQRAVDNYSKERLRWHMALVLKEKGIC